MGDLSLSGLSTGIDTASLVSQLMVVEGRRKASLEVDKMEKQESVQLWEQVGSLVSALESAANGLSDIGELKAFNTTLSDEDKLGITATSSAYEGSHSIEINQLATSARLVHDGLKYDTDYVGSGNFIYTYDNQEVVLNVPEGTTLIDLVGLINNDDKNPGVTASIMKYDNGADGVYHLVLSGQDSGSDYAININNSNSQQYTSGVFNIEDDKNASLSTKIGELVDFTGEFSTSGIKDQINIQGIMHDGTAINKSFDVTEHTTIEHLINEINEAFTDIDGNLTAKAVFEDGQIRIMNSTAGATSMELTSITFVQGENSTADIALPAFSMVGSAGGTITSGMDMFTAAGVFTETQKAQDSMIRVDGYPATGWISSSTNSVTGVIDGVTLDLHDVTEPGEEVKISLTRNKDKLKKAINSMVSAYNALAGHLKEQSKYDAEADQAGPLIGDSTVRMLMGQMRNPFFGTAVGFSDDDKYSLASQIGLEINADGKLELDSTKFNEAIDENYDAVFELIGAVGKGRVTGGDSDRFVFNSSQEYTESGDYEIKVEYPTEGQSVAYIRKVGETEWRTAEMDGNKILGDYESKDANGDYYPERGLVLTFDPPEPATGTYTATVSVKQGVASTLSGILENYIDGDDSIIEMKKDAIKDSIKYLDESIEKEQDRLEKKQARLKAQYARLEAQIQSMQQQLQASGVLSMMTG